MEHYAVKSDQRHSLEKIENLILFEARVARAALHLEIKFIVAGASSGADSWASHEAFSTKSSETEVRSAWPTWQ